MSFALWPQGVAVFIFKSAVKLTNKEGPQTSFWCTCCISSQLVSYIDLDYFSRYRTNIPVLC
ncbi:hypothetical protein Lalb_Chr18g0057211 [Lupinus albus]|uniref:Uncharacterized protein n=1 Tax=Lupinus albus TaxID=3870 RepID=A0A6A4NZI9_LUPAL|nr:hypothetical protein Lalb_Chr18g0057211 [Lupinus albus]